MNIIKKLFCTIIGCCVCITGFSQKKPDLQQLVNKKKFEEVIKYAEKLSAADSSNFDTMFAIGQAYEGMLKYKPAYNYYKFCLAKDTTNADVLNATARIAANIGKVDEAFANYYRVIRQDSTNFYANYQLARLYYQTEQYEAAIFNYQRLIEQDKESSILWINMGDSYAKSDQMGAEAFSLFCYKCAFQLNPENAAYGNLLINTMLRTENKRTLIEAISVCDTALYYNPKNKKLLQCQGMTFYMNKQYAKADSVFTGLLLEKDSSFVNMKYAGVSRYRDGMFTNCIDLLEKTLLIDTTAVDVNLLLGSALGKTFDRKRAYVLFDKAEKHMQPEKEYQLQLAIFRGETYSADGNRDVAIKQYFKAYKINPNRKELLQKISNYYWAKNMEDYKGDDASKALFIKLTVVDAFSKDKENQQYLTHMKPQLKMFQEDMFFRGLKSYPLISPEGKKSSVTAEKLSEIINSIPDKQEKKEPNQQ